MLIREPIGIDIFSSVVIGIRIEIVNGFGIFWDLGFLIGSTRNICTFGHEHVCVLSGFGILNIKL
jgi:hypothetical protein